MKIFIGLLNRHQFYVLFSISKTFSLCFVCFYNNNQWVCSRTSEYGVYEIGRCETRSKCIKYLRYYVNSVWL